MTEQEKQYPVHRVWCFPMREAMRVVRISHDGGHAWQTNCGTQYPLEAVERWVDLPGDPKDDDPKGSDRPQEHRTIRVIRESLEAIGQPRENVVEEGFAITRRGRALLKNLGQFSGAVRWPAGWGIGCDGDYLLLENTARNVSVGYDSKSHPALEAFFKDALSEPIPATPSATHQPLLQWPHGFLVVQKDGWIIVSDGFETTSIAPSTSAHKFISALLAQTSAGAFGAPTPDKTGDFTVAGVLSKRKVDVRRLPRHTFVEVFPPGGRRWLTLRMEEIPQSWMAPGGCIRLIENEDFAEWNGGERPVPDGVIVEIKAWDGRLQRGKADRFYWDRRDPVTQVQIVAYRVIGYAEGWE